jgi:CRP/FNR family cyclic AMP-dependent transcriptional regulator
MVASALAKDVESGPEADSGPARFLSGLEPDIQKELYAQGKIRWYKREQLVLAKGTNSGLLYILIKGTMKVTHCENKRHLTLAVLRSGDMFGELSMINGQATTADIIALQNCTVLEIEHDRVYAMFQKHSDFMCLFLETLSQRTRQVIESICVMALEDVYGRLRRTLLALAKESASGHKITGITQTELAEMVGSSREMVSIIMKELKIGDYLRVDGRTITLLKEFPLRR